MKYIAGPISFTARMISKPKQYPSVMAGLVAGGFKNFMPTATSLNEALVQYYCLSEKKTAWKEKDKNAVGSSWVPKWKEMVKKALKWDNSENTQGFTTWEEGRDRPADGCRP